MKFNWNEFSVVFLWVVFIFMAPVASGQDEKQAALVGWLAIAAALRP